MEKAFRENAGEGGAVLGVDVAPQQLDLLRDPETGKLPSDVFRRARSGDVPKRGRPLGAGNKRNAKLAKLIVQQHGDPVMYLASVYALPLDQLVEMLQIADGSADHTERLVELVEQTTQFLIDARRQAAIASQPLNEKTLKRLGDVLERVSDMAAALKTKPGELAVKALAAQINAAKEVGPYVHGKQPLSVEVKGKADMVLLIPGLNAPLGVDTKQLQDAIEAHGVDAIDFENMTLIDHVSAADDGEDEDDDNG